MTSHSARANTLCLAVTLALTTAPAVAEPLKYVYRDGEFEETLWSTRYHIEIYDSRVHSTKDADHPTNAAVTASQSSLIMERTLVTTRGKDMAGVGVDGPVDSRIQDSNITTFGDGAVGIEAGGRIYRPEGGVRPEGTVTVRRTAVETFGAQSNGINHALGGWLVLEGSRVTTHGAGSMGISAYSSDIQLIGSEITTTGADAAGIHARSTWLGGASGTMIGYNSDLDLRDSHVQAQGVGSAGIHAFYHGERHESIGAALRLRGSSVRSAQSHAVKFDGGDANVLALSERSVLDGADAVLFSDRSGTVARVTANDSTLIGRGQRAVVAGNGAVIHLALDNSDVSVEAGMGLAGANNGGRVDLRASNSRLQGSAFADATSQLDIALDASLWDAWGQSQVDQLSLRNGSTLLLGAGSVGDQLIVQGDFAIDDSTLVFDSALGDDNALTDRLWVQGDTSGQGAVVVNNVGGRGAQTVNGIQLIQVDGVSGANLKLNGRAVGGVYEYFLYKGSKGDPADGGWYLRSELDPCSLDGACEPPPPRPVPCSVDAGQAHCEPGVIDPPPPRPVPCSVDAGQSHCEPGVVDPPPPRPVPCSVDAGQAHCEREVIVPPPLPVLRPEPGAYLANQMAATQMFALRAADRQAQARDGGSTVGGPWASISGSQANYGVIGGQLRVDGNRSVLQVGTDVWAWGDGQRGRLGVFAARGRADNTVTSVLTGYRATGKVDGQSLGLYAGWSQAPSSSTGLFVDASLQHARYQNSVQGEALAKERHDSRASSAAVEAGYAFQLMTGGRAALFVEPQVQLRYTRYSADALAERNGTVIDGSDADGLSTRMGVRVFGHATLAQANRVQPFVAVNWIRESSDNSMRFDGERLAGGLPQDRYEAKAGARVQFGQRWSAWADMGWQRGGGYREVTGQIGLRASW